MATKTAAKFDLHKASIITAREEVANHIQDYDGERCFNRYTFLEALESRLDGIWISKNSPTGKFRLDSVQAARYLYLCLVLEQGDEPCGDTFRGMPILD